MYSLDCEEALSYYWIDGSVFPLHMLAIESQGYTYGVDNRGKDVV